MRQRITVPTLITPHANALLIDIFYTTRDGMADLLNISDMRRGIITSLHRRKEARRHR